ncbi:MAG: hypothetical protein J5907_08865 [Bacteroidales bacterium]|nr:hypothetical protein [Bacteroidales bacterium]
MDIDLFSDIVKSLILDNDEVTLPGLGTFVSELMPSTFSDKGYTINPPYRRLSFRQRSGSSDSLLVDFYSKTNDIDPDKAAEIVGDFLEGLKETLSSKKLVVLPGLGRLRATKENAFFFIADEDLDIFPDGFGLEPVSLKAHEETQEALAAEDPAPAAESPSSAVKPKKSGRFLKIVLGVAGCLILALALFVILSRLAPDFVDHLLYNKEELMIINYPDPNV